MSRTAIIVRQGHEVETDYRLMKECKAFASQKYDVTVLHFRIDNEARGEKAIPEGGTIITKTLTTRKLFGPSRCLLPKLIEQWFRAFAFIVRRRPHTVCVHDERLFGLIPWCSLLRKTGRLKRLIWDQRELPEFFVPGSAWKKSILSRLMRMCDAIASANPERMEFVLNEIGMQANPQTHIPIHNYPDQCFAGQGSADLPHELASWLDNASYVYIQSPNEHERFLSNTVDAVLATKNLRAVITGLIPPADQEALHRRHGTQLTNRVRFLGLLPTLQLPCLLDHSVGSIVLYDESTINTKLCAPNRLYQSLSRGTPVIVGSNTSMANLVKSTGAGVALETDGRLTSDIANGISDLMDNYETYKSRATSIREDFRWESQEAAVQLFLFGHSKVGKRNGHPSAAASVG